ncbi:MAG: helix-turn-helix domain-containing protein [Pseudomonadota bacterium]|nr:helix-turn-helix domain-containing protein [Pseudomonadota bacterium]
MTDETPSLRKIEWVAPSRDLSDFVHSFFISRSEEGPIEDMMPSYSAQIFIFVHGKGQIHYPDREPGRSGNITLAAPMMRAAPMMLEGPCLTIGASLTPSGWAAISGKPADKVHDCTFEADTVIEAEKLRPLEAAIAKCREGSIDARALCTELENTVRSVALEPGRAPKDDHRKLLAAIEAWLASEFNPPVQALYDSVELGPRQVQRVCRRYYGVPPAQLLKRYRAIRAAMLLAHEDLPAEYRDEVLGAYFDQAHLIHDIRRYTGRTPKRLPNEPLAQDLLNPDGHGIEGKKLRDI